MTTTITSKFEREIKKAQRNIDRAACVIRTSQWTSCLGGISLPGSLWLHRSPGNHSLLALHLAGLAACLSLGFAAGLVRRHFEGRREGLEQQHDRWHPQLTTMTWNYSNEEWERYTRERLETLLRSSVLIRTSLLALGIAAWFLLGAVLPGEQIGRAVVVITVTIGMVVHEWKRYRETSEVRRLELLDNPIAIFGNSGVIFGDRLISWKANGKELREIEIECESQLKLRLCIQNRGSEQPCRKRIEIPIPESIAANESIDLLTRLLNPRYSKAIREVLPYTFHDSIAILNPHDLDSQCTR